MNNHPTNTQSFEEQARQAIASIGFNPKFDVTHGGCPPRYLGGELTKINEALAAITSAHRTEVEREVGEIMERYHADFYDEQDTPFGDWLINKYTELKEMRERLKKGQQ